MPLFFFAAGLILAWIHTLIQKGKRQHARLYFLYFLFFNVGLSSVAAFIAHAFYSNWAAQYIGWPSGSPFQIELAIANLALGVLGLYAPFRERGFWLASLLFYTIFLEGCAINHVREIALIKDLNPGNAGSYLYVDFILPVVGWLFYHLSKKSAA